MKLHEKNIKNSLKLVKLKNKRKINMKIIIKNK